MTIWWFWLIKTIVLTEINNFKIKYSTDPTENSFLWDFKVNNLDLLRFDVDPVAWDSFVNWLFQPFIIKCFVGFEFDDKKGSIREHPIPYLVESYNLKQNLPIKSFNQKLTIIIENSWIWFFNCFMTRWSIYYDQMCSRLDISVFISFAFKGFLFISAWLDQ